MFYCNLPKELGQAVLAMTQDKEFQRRYREDQILNDLDDEESIDYFADLLATYNFKLRYNGKVYNNLTPMMWSYLWCSESPLVRETKKEATQADVDLFFYLLENGVKDVDFKETLLASFDYCKNKGITQKDAFEVIHILISRAFAPYKMFPQPLDNNKKKKVPVFDGDWLTDLLSKVHESTGMRMNEIMTDLSLTACCYYYVQYCRNKGVENIERRPPAEIQIAKMNRQVRMVVDYLVELGKVKPEDAEATYQLIITPPKK